MGFRPLGERHAIQEVVFILNFARPFESAELDRFFAAHESWKAELPKAERPQMLQFFFGQGMAPGGAPPAPPSTTTPAIFQSFRRDGALEWQMQANQNWLAVNCLAYSRWDAISKHALSLLERGVAAFGSVSLPIVGLTLQYIDTFLWEGSLQEYDCGLLLNSSSGMLPSSFRPDGPAWHFHSATFDMSGVDRSRPRLMRRVHVDSQIEGMTSVSRFDISLTADFIDPSGGLGLIDFVQAKSEFQILHQENKKLLSELISRDMQKRIALNGA